MTSTDQGTLTLYACRECGVELEYQGVGRPPVYCAEHRPTSFPALRGVHSSQQLNGGVSQQVTANTVGPSHHGDPDTSRQAARRNALRSGSQRVRVLLALAERASTDWELECALGLKHSSVGTRRGELVAIGLVEKTDERRLTDTGSTAVVWRCTPAGIDRARELRG